MIQKIENEIWIPIKGYEDLYEVSSNGQIKSLRRLIVLSKGSYWKQEMILKPQKDTGGYLQVGLSKNRKVKIISIHRLVAIAFLTNYENKKCVNHKNGIKDDNRFENLEWCSYSENLIHSIYILGTGKIPTAPDLKGNNNKRSKKVFCKNTGIIYESAGDAARKLGMYQGNISRICRGIYKQEKGLVFSYI